MEQDLQSSGELGVNFLYSGLKSFFTHPVKGIPAVCTQQMHLCCPSDCHILFPTCLQHRSPLFLHVHWILPSDEWIHLCIHYLVLYWETRNVGTLTLNEVHGNNYNTYQGISLLHHHHGHSLSYSDLLHNWNSPAALLLCHYIRHHPRE